MNRGGRTRLAELRAVARLARRTARREWRRTALVAALVAVPVTAGVVVAGVMRASDVTLEEKATSHMGTADVHVTLQRHGRTRPLTMQDPDVATMDELVAAVGAERVVRFRTISWYQDGLGVLEGTLVTDQPVDDPLTDGMLTVLHGRAPIAPGEIALSEELLDRHGLAAGDEVLVDGAGALSIVGAVVDPANVTLWRAVLHPQTLDRLAEAHDASVQSFWLLGGVTEPEAAAQQLSAAYDRATGYADAQDPAHESQTGDARGPDRATTPPGVADQHAPEVQIPASPGFMFREDLLRTLQSYQSGFDRVMTPQVIATMVTAVLLAEVALIAGAAYATGARRRLRELGLLGANGATNGHLRAAVVGEATVTGIIGGTVGVVAGVAALGLGRPLVQRFTTPLITRLELSVTDLVGPALVAVLAVSFAAWRPARTAARVPTTTALEGRMPLAAPRRWIVPAGIGLAGFGALLLLVGILASGDVGGLVAAIGILFAIGGTALLTVPIIAGIGRLADRFPAPLRLVLRDSSRQRTRAAAASASAMVVLMAPVLIATVSLTIERWDLRHGLPTPDNHVLVPPMEQIAARANSPAYDGPDRDLDRDDALDGVTEMLPDATRVDVAYLDERASVAPDPRFTAPRRPTETEQAVDVGRLPPDFWYMWSSRDTHTALAASQLVDALAAPEVASAIEDGKLVVLGLAERDTSVVIDGQQVSAVERPVRVLRDRFPRVLIPPDRADELGLDTAGIADLFVNPDPITPAQRRALQRPLDGIDISVGSVELQNGPWVRWAAVGATLLVALLILGLVTMLSATESDHDLRTMVAVGAAPGMRRRFLGLQSGVHALVGAILAVPLAATFVWVASKADADRVMEGVFGAIPSSAMWLDWTTMTVVLVGVPAAIGLLTALLVRSAPTVPPRRLG